MSTPVVQRRKVQIVLAVSLVFLAGMGARSFAPDASRSAPAAQAAPEGQKVYLARCMSCHQMSGEGVAGVFPPLAGSEWVTGDKGRLIRLILHGMTGPIEVKGVKYASAMPPWGTFLTDADVAAVGTYIRGAWGNEADGLTATEVASVRAATADRKAPWTADELAKNENLGVPDAD